MQAKPLVRREGSGDISSFIGVNSFKAFDSFNILMDPPDPGADADPKTTDIDSWEPHTFAEETKFLEDILKSDGKLKPGYSGKQRLLGFQKGRLFDEDGMFAFDDSIKSVAIDIGAATNPLDFDLARDASQFVMLFEGSPDTSKGLYEAFEKDNQALQARGGCDTRYEGVCNEDRRLLFNAACSTKVGYTNFIMSDNPYCNSLGNFTEKSGANLDPILANDPEMSSLIKSCWNAKSRSLRVRTVTLASVLRRIPKHLRVKYMKIDAQGHDFFVLKGASEQMSRIDYVRFEMQVDPPANRKMVKDIPSYAEVEQWMRNHGFDHEGNHACSDATMSDFSKAIREMECIFCREKPCVESGKPPLGMHPADVVKLPESWKWLATSALKSN